MATIASGDQVIVYSSREQVASITITPAASFQSRFGFFKHDEMVGTKWGSKFPSANGRGFVYLLKPTPELWTLAVPHRTQILYLPDIAFITSFLDIKAGTKVIEAGTGSGSLSHSLARTVGPKGKVFSFEYHEERFLKVKEEFKSHGLEEVVQLKHQDVCKNAFELVNEVDSVFLDLPAPWQAIEHAKTSLKKDRLSRICCFSPCIEQVIRTVSSLSDHGFSDITCYETLIRTHDPALATAPDISTAIDRIKGVEEKKGKRREGQIREAKRKREEKEEKKRMDEEAAALAAASGALIGVGEEGEGDVPKEEGEASSSSSIIPDTTLEPLPVPFSTSTPSSPQKSTTSGKRKRDDTEADDTPDPEVANGGDDELPPPSSSWMPVAPRKFQTSKPSGLSRGHTSFLTFAILRPARRVEEKGEENGEKEGEGEQRGVEVIEEGGKVEREGGASSLVGEGGVRDKESEVKMEVDGAAVEAEAATS